MKRVFVDTNVVLDFMLQRHGYFQAALGLFKLADNGKLHLHIAGHTVTNAYYLLDKSLGNRVAREQLQDFLELVSVVPFDKPMLRNALLLSDFKDYEDAIQLTCALTIDNLYCIVTRNQRDFKSTPVRVLSPEELMKELIV